MASYSADETPLRHAGAIRCDLQRRLNPVWAFKRIILHESQTPATAGFPALGARLQPLDARAHACHVDTLVRKSWHYRWHYRIWASGWQVPPGTAPTIVQVATVVSAQVGDVLRLPDARVHGRRATPRRPLQLLREARRRPSLGRGREGVALLPRQRPKRPVRARGTRTPGPDPARQARRSRTDDALRARSSRASALPACKAARDRRVWVSGWDRIPGRGPRYARTVWKSAGQFLLFALRPGLHFFGPLLGATGALGAAGAYTGVPVWFAFVAVLLGFALGLVTLAGRAPPAPRGGRAAAPVPARGRKDELRARSRKSDRSSALSVSARAGRLRCGTARRTSSDAGPDPSGSPASTTARSERRDVSAGEPTPSQRQTLSARPP